MGIEKTIAQYIEQHQLLSPDGLSLVAVSGGADSVCLLLLLKQLGFRVEAVHCNFKLRGAESDRDEQFVKTLCQIESIPFHLTHFDTAAYASMHKVSIEMAARQLRYAYFEQLRRDVGAEAICVAHHQDDSVETILLNLIRGTGLRGLTGIKPRNGRIVRPLLCVSRSEIEQWLDGQRQPFITDSTNLVPDVVRNKLRLNILPQLRAISPCAPDNILTTARRIAEAVRVYDHAIAASLTSLHDTADSIDIDQLLQEPSAEAVLYEWLSPLGFTPDTIETIARRLPLVQAGREWHSPTHLLTVSRGKLIVSPHAAQERPVLQLPEPGTYLYQTGERLRLQLHEGSHIIKEGTTACLDAGKVVFPLVLRPVQTGDRFQPFGMKGTKLVSDYLTDRHLSIIEKRRQLILTDSQGHVLWLVGQRPDARFTVGSNTQQTLIITYERS